MAKRKLYQAERTLLKREVKLLKDRKDWLVKEFVREVQIIDEEIARTESILEAGEVEEEVFDGC